jgi:YfiH family protein
MMVMSEPQPTRGFSWTQETWGVALRCDPLAAVARHLFTIGNLQLRDDEREWSAVARAMDVARERIRLVRQVHGSAVSVVRGHDVGSAALDEADVIVSSVPDVAIGVRVADCAPILIGDQRLGCVAAVHAGWRGTLSRAAAAGVTALRAELGSRPADLIAAIGPCLGPCCGEVGPEVVDAFRAAGHPSASIDGWFAAGRSGRPYLDLWRANRDQLEESGVLSENIYVAGLCTKTHVSLMHSYRVQGAKAGRMLAIIRSTVLTS